MLKLENLQIKRGSLVIAEDLSFNLERGKIYTILGPNGAGKSSLIKTIFGEVPFTGNIQFNDKTLNKHHLLAWRKAIGYMPQDTQVEASLTALEVILLGRLDALNMHVSDELLTEAATIMAKLGIAHLAHKDIMRLSGGQRQMVMFAQVLLRSPQILMLDEPVSALDMHHQINLLEHVCEYTKQNQLITIMVLHDLSLAAQFSDDIILLGNGKLQGFGDAKQVLQADLISRLYNVETEILYDRTGQPVIRPLRKKKT
ncbi:ABC transporter ATP-binding protein [Actinobacillus succinogenes]|uniref:ABC transporter related n=1 Tax=Actinobacillus succinogenes (strain ATCC 55618 / DSM 22257 / CCUG 43843 / 130Z) TaxID=339671 RepID=A6VMS7_ACTSZ|nr:ABC transporter ATP-binding protein [Actinobacillus succinogenes]ABR74274.1 ABC transporter related [Actinobacillus succinogenes 130Z]PHI39299.1 ABC transporter ATP-binding protein [Actinobacillus succinogenes]